MLKGEKELSRGEFLRRRQWDIASRLAEHELLSETYWSDGREAAWVIGRPGTSVDRLEILAAMHGSLIVHGDWDLVRFASYRDTSGAFDRLCWMGCHEDVGYYVREKSQIGTGRMLRDEYEEAVARFELRERIRDEGEDPKYRAIFEEALGHTETREDLSEFLAQHIADFYEYSFGEVVAWPVVGAHRACARLVALLEEKYGADGPPACRPTHEGDHHGRKAPARIATAPAHARG